MSTDDTARDPAAPAPAVPEQTNVAALIAVVSGGLSFFVMPIVLAPLAVIAGVVGDQQGKRIGGRRMASWGVVLGLLGLLFMFVMQIRAANGV